jgi:hypothetical protein
MWFVHIFSHLWVAIILCWLSFDTQYSRSPIIYLYFCQYLTVLIFFETRSCYVAKAGLKLMILLPQPPVDWDYRHVPPHSASHCTDYCSFVANLKSKVWVLQFFFFFKIILQFWVSFMSTFILESGCQFLQKPAGIFTGWICKSIWGVLPS